MDINSATAVKLIFVGHIKQVVDLKIVVSLKLNEKQKEDITEVTVIISMRRKVNKIVSYEQTELQKKLVTVIKLIIKQDVMIQELVVVVILNEPTIPITVTIVERFVVTVEEQREVTIVVHKLDNDWKRAKEKQDYNKNIIKRIDAIQLELIIINTVIRIEVFERLNWRELTINDNAGRIHEDELNYVGGKEVNNGIINLIKQLKHVIEIEDDDVHVGEIRSNVLIIVYTMVKVNKHELVVEIIINVTIIKLNVNTDEVIEMRDVVEKEVSNVITNELNLQKQVGEIVTINDNVKQKSDLNYHEQHSISKVIKHEVTVVVMEHVTIIKLNEVEN